MEIWYPLAQTRSAFRQSPPKRLFASLQLRSEITQALVFIGFLGPRPYTSDWYACKLLQAILAEGDSSKLNYELRREQGLASSITYQSLELRQQGGFSFSIATSARNIEAVEAAVFIELEKIKNGQLEDAEIERAKNLVERRFYLDQEDIANAGQTVGPVRRHRPVFRMESLRRQDSKSKSQRNRSSGTSVLSVKPSKHCGISSDGLSAPGNDPAQPPEEIGSRRPCESPRVTTCGTPRSEKSENPQDSKQRYQSLLQENHLAS